MVIILQYILLTARNWEVPYVLVGHSANMQRWNNLQQYHSHSVQNWDARTRAHHFSYTRKQLWWSPSVRPCVAITVGSGRFGTFQRRKIASISNFGVCHAHNVLCQQCSVQPKNCTLQHLLRRSRHCWSTWRTPGALYVCTNCTSSEICNTRCVKVMHKSLQLHAGCSWITLQM